jgi:hypothetical protein
MIGLLLRMVPFLGPLMTLGGFLPRLLHLKREKAVHREAGEPFPQNYQAEIDAHTVRTQKAGWRLGFGIMSAAAAFFGFQAWDADNGRDKAQQLATTERLNKESAIRQRDQFVTANRDFAAANGQLQAALSTNNANCRQAITNANVRANLEIDKRTAKKKELIKHALKPKADGAGEPSVPDPDDLLRAYAQSAPGANAAAPIAASGPGEDPS